MSEESAIAFHKLVGAMRTTENEYWTHRDKNVLKKSIELEKRVDDTIMKADGKDVPQDENGSFFLLVAELRTATKQYFSEKKKPQPDQELTASLYKTIKQKEAKVDKQLVAFRDKQISRQGYIIEHHVMERPYRGMAHSIYHSQDEQLAKIELGEYLSHAGHGTMYYLCKRYIGTNGKPLSPEEIDNIINNNSKF